MVADQASRLTVLSASDEEQDAMLKVQQKTRRNQKYQRHQCVE